jgi:hypothetical protein
MEQQVRRRAVGDPKFKPCTQHQDMLLPPSLSELIPEAGAVA